ncbi:MAG: hypothetical protein D8H99_02475 [Streptococcus sp.]|nr:MAG: hypothetical protein D8H99_02475 [Streptococcus sp.]
MGYIGQSRSERSQQAIDEGLLTKNQLKAWQKRAVEQGVIRPCEWHHTGKYFNKTEYYDPIDFEGLNPKDFPPVKKEKTADKQVWYVLVSAEWGGTKRFRKIVGANVVVKNKITAAQKSANKYCLYGGYIKEFDSQEEAEEFAKTAELRD